MVANGRQTLYTYDAWGRTTGTFTGVEEWEYEYRFGNYLKRAERSESGASQERVEYINDGNGKRRLRQVTDTSFGGSGVITAQTWYRWAGLEELGEYEQGGGGFWDIGTKTLSHIPGLGAVAGASQATGDYRHYLTDHLGSTRSIRDGAKAPLARYAYTPYGQPTVNVGLTLNIGYTGHAWDNVTQQWFAPYRYYDPSNARWLWRDPLGFVDGPNMYGYAGANPLPCGQVSDLPTPPDRRSQVSLGQSRRDRSRAFPKLETLGHKESTGHETRPQMRRSMWRPDGRGTGSVGSLARKGKWTGLTR